MTLFKARLLHGKGLTTYKGLLQEVVRLALEKGIVLGRVQLVDSVHTLADVNTSKDEKCQEKGEGTRDGDARWGAKGKKQGRTWLGLRRASLDGADRARSGAGDRGGGGSG